MSDHKSPSAAFSLEVLRLISQYKKLDAKRSEGLSPTEEKTYADLVKKLSQHLEPSGSKVETRRQELRVQAKQQIQISSGKDFKKAYMENISGGGVYIATTEFQPVGTMIQMEFFLKEENFRFELDGKITWVNPKSLPNLPAGMGVQFQNFTSEHERFVRKLIHGQLDKSLARSLKDEKPK